MTENKIQTALFALRDEDYRAFTLPLIPGVAPERVIGVRTPALRKLAKQLRGDPQAADFLQTLPHEYYEEDNLHGLLLCARRDYDETVSGLDAFLPFVNNWATCDLLRPVSFAKHKALLRKELRRWMASAQVYTVRFGIEMLMTHFLDADFDPRDLRRVAAIRTDAYYLRMMQAWYFATALAKQWDAALPILQGRALEPWTRRKSIQKALESFRVPEQHKQILRKLRDSL